MKLTEAYALLKKELGEGHYSIDCETWDRGKGLTVDFTVYARPIDDPHDSSSVSDTTLEGAVNKLIQMVNGAVSAPIGPAEDFMRQAELLDASP